jgi:S1-C subfamily serine protease
MRIKETLAWLASVSLIGGAVYWSAGNLALKPSYASEVAQQEIASLNKEAPKFGRKPLLPADVKVLLDRGHGSGVHIGGGYYVTAAHVARHAKTSKRFDVKFLDKSIKKADVLWINEEYDLAMIRADADGVESAELRCEWARRGDEIRVFGNPMDLEFIMTIGRIAGDARTIAHWRSAYVVDVTIAVGNSGGPVYDVGGKIIGILVGGSDSGFAIAVPSYNVCQLLARI